MGQQPLGTACRGNGFGWDGGLRLRGLDEEGGRRDSSQARLEGAVGCGAAAAERKKRGNQWGGKREAEKRIWRERGSGHAERRRDETRRGRRKGKGDGRAAARGKDRATVRLALAGRSGLL